MSHQSPSFLTSHLQIHMQSFRLGTKKDKKQILSSLSNPLAQELSCHGWKSGMRSLLSGGQLVPGPTLPSPAVSLNQQAHARVRCCRTCAPSTSTHVPRKVRLHLHSLSRTHHLQHNLLGFLQHLKVISIHFRKLGKFKKANRKSPLMSTHISFALLFTRTSLRFPRLPGSWRIPSVLQLPLLNPALANLSPQFLSYPQRYGSTQLGWHTKR